MHTVFIKDCVFIYNPHYRIFKFPSILRNGEKIEKWVDRTVNTRKQKKTKLPRNFVIVIGCVVIILLMVNQLLHTYSQN